MIPIDVEVGDDLRDRYCSNCGTLWDAGTCRLCGFNGGIMKGVNTEKLYDEY